MKVSALIFPHQLFREHPALKRASGAWLYEHPRFFNDHSFHKQKLILHRASMKAYAGKLQHKMHVRYAELQNFPTLGNVLRDMRKHGVKEVHVTNVIDAKLSLALTKAAKIAKLKLIVHESPMFLLGAKEAASMIDKLKSVGVTAFYAKMRKKFDVLIDKQGGPLGGSWSFDTENRKRLPKSAPIPELHYPKRCETATEAFTYVEKRFRRNPGHTEGFMYPTTHEEASVWLEDFLRHRLAEFGDYEDAISHDEHALFHSILSPLLNIGLITPTQVIDATLHHARRHPIRLNCLEGFIRNILGWREYVRAVYEKHGEKQRKMNFFKCKRKLTKAFIKGMTGLLPVDTTLTKIQETAYCYRAERLMILGNYLLLTETAPADVYNWYMSNFIDAYDWTVTPNIYGVSQFADGGITTLKPSLASSNYIRNMSDYQGGEWEKILDGLFWRFLSKHPEALQLNPRLAALFEQMCKSPERLKKHLDLAEEFLKKTK